MIKGTLLAFWFMLDCTPQSCLLTQIHKFEKVKFDVSVIRTAPGQGVIYFQNFNEVLCASKWSPMNTAGITFLTHIAENEISFEMGMKNIVNVKDMYIYRDAKALIQCVGEIKNQENG